jgi:hypothetical protein
MPQPYISLIANGVPNAFAVYLGTLGISCLVNNDPVSSRRIARSVGMAPYTVGNGQDAFFVNEATREVDMSLWESPEIPGTGGKRDYWLNIRGTQNRLQVGDFAWSLLPVPDAHVDAVVMPWVYTQYVALSRTLLPRLIPYTYDVNSWTICGHSLGGAVGYYLARCWSLYYPDVPIQLLTFGSPKCMGSHSLDMFDHVRLWGINERPHVGCDPVPYLPPSASVRPDLLIGRIPAIEAGLATRLTSAALRRRIASFGKSVLGLELAHQAKPWYAYADGGISSENPGNWIIDLAADIGLSLAEFLRTGALLHAMSTMYLPHARNRYQRLGGGPLSEFNSLFTGQQMADRQGPANPPAQRRNAMPTLPANQQPTWAWFSDYGALKMEDHFHGTYPAARAALVGYENPAQCQRLFAEELQRRDASYATGGVPVGMQSFLGSIIHDFESIRSQVATNRAAPAVLPAPLPTNPALPVPAHSHGRHY